MAQAAQASAGTPAAIAAAAEKYQRPLWLLQPGAHLFRQAAQRYAMHGQALEDIIHASGLFMTFAHIHQNRIAVLLQEAGKILGIELQRRQRRLTLLCAQGAAQLL